jgi:hypothetical protein
VLAGIGAWLLMASGDERAKTEASKAEPDDDDNDVERVAVADTPEPPPEEEAPSPSPQPKPEASADQSHVGQVVGPHPDDPHLPGMVPHPETPEHERIFAENRLIQQLNDLMAFRKTKEMREKLIEYKKLDPTDVEATQAGYLVIANCIDYPGEGSLAAARQFYDTQRHSPLRRFVRRICFENSN